MNPLSSTWTLYREESDYFDENLIQILVTHAYNKMIDFIDC